MIHLFLIQELVSNPDPWIGVDCGYNILLSRGGIQLLSWRRREKIIIKETQSWNLLLQCVDFTVAANSSWAALSVRRVITSIIYIVIWAKRQEEICLWANREVVADGIKPRFFRLKWSALTRKPFFLSMGQLQWLQHLGWALRHVCPFPRIRFNSAGFSTSGKCHPLYPSPLQITLPNFICSLPRKDKLNHL